ncbi:MAG: hypothetical protein HFI46_03930 [Lachnospiraceae bacterium]|jgi:unsaturated rhamnogalacturonyl hydrolase|nr:hypothetical protein [Lachnospiraceae bacterium]
MRAEKYIEEILKESRVGDNGFGLGDTMLLLGACRLHEASQEERYSAFVESCLGRWLCRDGLLHALEERKPAVAGLGPVLFYMLDETGEETYQKAVKDLMRYLADWPRCACGSFAHDPGRPAQLWLRDTFSLLPFYMEYETKIGKKENYSDIIRQFDNVQKLLYNEERGLCRNRFDETAGGEGQIPDAPDFLMDDTGLYLMALVDTMGSMSIQVFEQYKRLERIFRQVISGVLRYRDGKSGLFYRKIDGDSACGKDPDTAGSLMAAYSILRACGMGALLLEKYAHFGREILENVTESWDRRFKEGGIPSPVEAGAFLMAFSQYQMLRERME